MPLGARSPPRERLRGPWTRGAHGHTCTPPLLSPARSQDPGQNTDPSAGPSGTPRALEPGRDPAGPHLALTANGQGRPLPPGCGLGSLALHPPGPPHQAPWRAGPGSLRQVSPGHSRDTGGLPAPNPAPRLPPVHRTQRNPHRPPAAGRPEPATSWALGPHARHTPQPRRQHRKARRAPWDPLLCVPHPCTPRPPYLHHQHLHGRRTRPWAQRDPRTETHAPSAATCPLSSTADSLLATSSRPAPARLGSSPQAWLALLGINLTLPPTAQLPVLPPREHGLSQGRGAARPQCPAPCVDTLAAPGAGRGLTLLCPAGTHDRPGHRHPAPIHVPGTPPSCLPRAAQISEDIPHHSPGRPEGTAAPGTQHSPSRCSAHTGPGPLALLHFSRPQSAADSAPPRATWRPTASTSLGNAAGAPGFSMTTKDSARERHWQPRRPREGPGQGVRPRPNGHLGKAPRPASSLPTRTWVGSPAEAKAPAAHPQPTDSLCARHRGQDPAEASRRQPQA